MKNILIGVTGSIAAYKACELVRLLVKAEFSVKVVMTENAKKFIHPNTFEALSANPVYCDMFENSMQHIELAKWADSIIIAPATASTISKLASGSAECLLTTLCLASQAICFIAPAMNKVMFQNPATIKNMAQLKLNGFRIIASNYGQQACGDIGLGRMTEPENIFNTIMQRSSLFKGIKLIVTAGPTHEKIDPVRYVSNFSSGKMGYALAKAAYEYGASVCLISGPTNLLPPHGCQVIYVQSAEDMLNAVMKEALNTSILISSAAIADYRPQAFSKSKLKKEEESLTIKFSKTVDILTRYRNVIRIFLTLDLPRKLKML